MINKDKFKFSLVGKVKIIKNDRGVFDSKHSIYNQLADKNMIYL